MFILAIVLLVIGAAIVGISSFTGGANEEVEKAIATVQNGYLGEYTDITVREILDSYYGMLYENEEWDSGEIDSGSIIVQAKYYDEGMEEDATTIQFTMLNEECFKITAFVDALNPVEKATDLLAAMNYNYLLAYMAENRSVAGDPVAEKEFIARLGQISGSAVQYGASSDYRGNRATICEMDGKTPLDVSVTMLLDNYGLLDMSYYWGTDALYQETMAPYETEATVPVTEPSEIITTEPIETTTEGNTTPWTESEEYLRFWDTHTSCYDPMAGEYIGPVTDGRNLYFSISAWEDADGNITFWLSYPMGSDIVESDGEYFEVAKYVEIPSDNHSFTNRSAMVVFTIDEYYPKYSGDLVVNLQYTPAGKEYSVYANIPGVLDTKGETWIVDNVSNSEYE